MKNKKIRIFAIAIIFLLMTTSIVSIVNAFVPTTYYSDVLLVQIGEDPTIEETTQIIIDNLNDRNERLLEEPEKRKDRVCIQNIYGMFVTISEIKISQPNIYESRILDINVIQISVESLKKDILENYETQVLIIVGHGSEEGLKDEKDEMLWDDVGKIITNNSAKYSIIASCFSERGTKDLPNALGFPNIIDGIVAANIVSAILFKMLGETTLMENSLYDAFERCLYININPNSAQILYFSDVEIGYYIVTFTILILVTMINAVIPADASWAIRLFGALSVYGAANYLMNFALFAAGMITMEAMLSSLVGFFNVTLGAIISTYWASDPWEQICMIAVFGVGLVLTIAQCIVSAGAIVTAKYALMALAFISLGLSCYFDIMDSDGIVG